MAVVAACGAGVAVAGGFLDVAEWDAGVEGVGDEGVAEAMGVDFVGDSGSAGDASDDAVGLEAVEAAVSAEEDWSAVAFVDGEGDGSVGAGREGDDGSFSAFAVDEEGVVTAFEAEVFDVGVAPRRTERRTPTLISAPPRRMRR